MESPWSQYSSWPVSKIFWLTWVLLNWSKKGPAKKAGHWYMFTVVRTCSLPISSKSPAFGRELFLEILEALVTSTSKSFFSSSIVLLERWHLLPAWGLGVRDGESRISMGGEWDCRWVPWLWGMGEFWTLLLALVGEDGGRQEWLRWYRVVPNSSSSESA